MLVHRIHSWYQKQQVPYQGISAGFFQTVNALDSIAFLEETSTPLTIFGLDPRVAPPNPLQVIWWHHYIDSIIKRKDCVLKSIGDVKNSSNNISWGYKGHNRTNRSFINDRENLFSEFRVVNLGSAVGTVMRLKFTRDFAIRFYIWWYGRAKYFLISGYILNW